MNLNRYLRTEHLAIGLTLTDDEHFVYLKQNGYFKAIWGSFAPTLIAEVIHEADQILEWKTSGIIFTKAE